MTRPRDLIGFYPDRRLWFENRLSGRNPTPRPFGHCLHGGPSRASRARPHLNRKQRSLDVPRCPPFGGPVFPVLVFLKSFRSPAPGPCPRSHVAEAESPSTPCRTVVPAVRAPPPGDAPGGPRPRNPVPFAFPLCIYRVAYCEGALAARVHIIRVSLYVSCALCGPSYSKLMT